MSVVPFETKEEKERRERIVKIADSLDKAILELIQNEEESHIAEIAAVLANRAGELVRLYKGSKLELLYSLINIMHKRANKDSEEPIS